MTAAALRRGGRFCDPGDAEAFQWAEWPLSSFELVEKRMETTKVRTITVTTRHGEVMSMRRVGSFASLE